MSATDPQKTARTPTEEDSQIGTRLRLVRNMQGLTQEDFANQLDISFQQLQKYESGKNRISARILYKISQITNVPLNFFFEGSTAYEQNDTTAYGFADKNAEQEAFQGEHEDYFIRDETLDLLKAYYAIKDETARAEAVRLLRQIAQKKKD